MTFSVILFITLNIFIQAGLWKFYVEARTNNIPERYSVFSAKSADVLVLID